MRPTDFYTLPVEDRHDRPGRGAVGMTARGGTATFEEPEQEGARDVGYAIDLAQRCLQAGAYMVMIESEGITEEVASWRTDVVARIARELGLERIVFAAADPEVFGWYVKSCSPGCSCCSLRGPGMATRAR